MKRRERFSKIITALFIIFLIWFLLQLIAPLALPSNSVKDLSGSTAVEDNEETIEHMSFPWNSMYGCGDRLCHQKSERSLYFNGNQMPFCTRCTSIWLGMAIALGFMIFYTIKLNEKFMLIVIMGLAGVGSKRRLTSEYGGEWLRPDVGEISCMPRMSVGLANHPTTNL